jgi:hypothetical protein
MESKYKQIYIKRQNFDCQSQPTFSNDFKQISTDLNTNLAKDHPYSVSPTVEFTTNFCYKSGSSTWFNGIIDKNINHMYRIDNLYKLLCWNESNIVNKKNIRKIYSLNRFNGNLLDKSVIPELFDNIFEEDDKWPNLSELLLKYKTPRNITWWTDEDLHNINDAESLMGISAQLGLAANWINTYTVLVRCDIKNLIKDGYVNKIKVPNIIDAFNSPIFLSQNESLTPKFGKAINLIDLNGNGLREYIIRDIPLKYLHFKGIKITDICKKKYHFVEESGDLYNKIINLY